MIQRTKLRERLQGKKTYLLCALGVLHGIADWLELAPSEGSFDAGNTAALAEVIGSLAVMFFRMGLARTQMRIARDVAEIKALLKREDVQ